MAYGSWLTTTSTVLKGTQTWGPKSAYPGRVTKEEIPQRGEVVDMQRSGVVTPAYRSKVIRNQLPINDFSYQQTWKVNPQGFYKTAEKADSYWYHYWGTMENPPGWVASNNELTPSRLLTLTATELVTLEDTAKAQLLKRIKDQKVNVAHVMAERERTAKLLVETVQSIAKTVMALRKGRIHEAAQALGVERVSNRAAARFARDFKRDQSRAVARRWLEFQYGWKPLLGDVAGAAEALAKLQVGDTLRGKVRGRAVIDRIRTSDRKVTTDYRTYNFNDYKELYVEVNYVVYYAIDLKFSSTLSSLGLTNPFAIAWEMLPWSFVVDWAIPIGDWLNSLDATVGMRFEKGSKTVFEMGYLETEATLISQQADTRYTGYNFAGSFKRVKCTRTKLTSFPSTGIPRFKNPVSIIHVANAMALLRTAFKRS